MGSSSKSDTTKITTSTNKNENISGISDEAQLFNKVGGSVSILDGGAISDALDFGGDALDFGGDALRDLVDFGEFSLSNNADNFGDILDFGGSIIENQQTQLTDTLTSINAAAGTNADLNASRTAALISTGLKWGAAVLVVFFVANTIRARA